MSLNAVAGKVNSLPPVFSERVELCVGSGRQSEICVATRDGDF